MNNTGTTRVNTNQNQSRRNVSIEICQGPDCVGCGGGAAILEIEELVKEFQYQQGQDDEGRGGLYTVPVDKSSSMCAIVGGCRDLCTVGPNVRILQRRVGDDTNISSTKQSVVLESFHHVNDISSCRNVVENAASFVVEDTKEDNQEREVGQGVQHDDIPSDKKSTNLHQSMMTRRAGRIRWEALKYVSRTIAKCKKAAESACEESDVIPADLSNKVQRSNESCREQLSNAHRAGLSIARGDSVHEEREIRRAERLMKLMEGGLHKSLEIFDDESESDGDDNDDE